MSTATLPKPSTRTLGLADRCDRCGAQAFIRVQLPESERLTAERILDEVDLSKVTDPGELLFCGHHGREYEAAAGAVGAALDDQTSRINEKPSFSANAA